MHYCVPQGPWGPREGKVFIPLRGISHGMQGTEKTTVQDIENQIERGGDGPALNGPAPAPQGGQAGQSQIDKRAIKAIINVIKRKRSFVFMYEDVMNELEKLIPNKDERDEIIDKLKPGHNVWGNKAFVYDPHGHVERMGHNRCNTNRPGY